MSALAGKLRRFSRAHRALPLLYIEFSDDQAARGAKARRLRAAYKQAIAGALKASAGSVLRKNDLVAAGAGGQWFIALLAARPPSGRRPLASDPDLGVAAERLRRGVQRALAVAQKERQSSAKPQPHVTVRCGWNVLEPVDPDRPLEALRHAVRGAAVVARVEERRATVLAAVTHELRSPLTSVIGFAERLQDGRRLSGARRTRYLAIIADEARRLRRLAEGLIDVGAWSCGNLQLRPQRRDLAAIARQAAEVIGDLAARKNVSIQLSGTATAPVDHDRALQIFINVLDNALRYAPEGGRIRIRVAKRKGRCAVTIRDQGPGFSPAVRRSLGRPFASGASGKAGLGLAISRLLVEAHGGTLTIGTRGGGLVNITFPAAKPANATIPQDRTGVCE